MALNFPASPSLNDDAEIAELQAKRDILSTAIELCSTCGSHCEANGIGD